MKPTHTLLYPLLLTFTGHLVTAGSTHSPTPIVGDSILIKNVRLISREDSVNDVTVNLLIIGKTLELVTRDDIVLVGS